MTLSDRLGAWITAAQADGSLDPDLPPELVLYTLYARACDPVLGLLRAGGTYSADESVQWVLRTCFEGLQAKPATPQRSAREQLVAAG
ncbi:hypothetical protein L6R53_33990, partial [Myxococcota bacterium]|nr:hypothetical protein [Myxococcota bacterium]